MNAGKIISMKINLVSGTSINMSIRVRNYICIRASMSVGNEVSILAASCLDCSLPDGIFIKAPSHGGAHTCRFP